MRVRYFDNAATSWPKPKKVLKKMACYFDNCGGNPGRSGHRRSVEAGRMVLDTREMAAELFHVSDPSHILFTKNATEALNTVIMGVCKKGDHIITTSMEHNSVLRPLSFLQEKECEVEIIPTSATGLIDPFLIEKAIRKNTRLVICIHGSNVTGTINNIEEIGKICRNKGVLFLVDAAQTAGVVPLDISKFSVDFLAAAGHKGLLGPQGTGLLYVRNHDNIIPLIRGGTGSLSDREVQPDFLPDKLESGTLNVIGIAGLGEGIRFLLERGVEQIWEHDGRLLDLFLDALGDKSRIQCFGPLDKSFQTGLLSIRIDGISPSVIGERLDREYGILTRIGLHCAPAAHRTINTFPDGTVRFSWGYFTTYKDVLYAARALKIISRSF